jgi:UDP-N-acetyl-D-glucosamine dehydrogenase
LTEVPEFLSRSAPLPGTSLEHRIRARSALVGVVGQGYVGYPVAQQIAASGYQVIGHDTSPDALERCMASNGSHRYRVTGSIDQLADRDVIIIAVPTPTMDTESGRRPDLANVLAAVDALAEVFAQNPHDRLLVVESTYAPGTTRDLVAPRLGDTRRIGEDIFLGYSPERIDPGNEAFDLINTPKVTSGYDDRSAALTDDFYKHVVLRTIPASSMEAAEASKLLENTFRFVNITFAQEFDEYCETIGLSSHEVTSLAGTKPFGYMPFYAGPGIGGHCIAEDPYYLQEALHSLGQQAEILQAALKNHEARSGVIVRRIRDRVGRESLNGSRILILGVSYKPNIGDARQSPARVILRQLEAEGAKVDYHDPYVQSFADRPSVSLEALAPTDYDLAVVVTHHREYDLKAFDAAGWVLLDTHDAMSQRGNASMKPHRPGDPSRDSVVSA